MRQTSRVFAVWGRCIDLLNEQAWPAHPSTGIAPKVWSCDPVDQVQEGIIVSPRPADRQRQEWSTNVSADETFVITIAVGSKVPGVSDRVARERLEALCDIVQQAFRDPETGRPGGEFNRLCGMTSDLAGPHAWAVQSIEPQTYPLSDAGVGAYAEINVVFTARL